MLRRSNVNYRILCHFRISTDKRSISQYVIQQYKYIKDYCNTTLGTELGNLAKNPYILYIVYYG
jgi:hypothetical protein